MAAAFAPDDARPTRMAAPVVPTQGRREVLTVPLRDLAEIEITFGSRRERGVSFATLDGRRASFVGKADPRMACVLEGLGARVRHE